MKIVMVFCWLLSIRYESLNTFPNYKTVATRIVLNGKLMGKRGS